MGRPLFGSFESKAALRWVVFLKGIGLRDDWELLLANKLSNQRSHFESFIKVCSDGDLDLVRAMVERSKVDINHYDSFDRAPLHYAASNGHLPVVQYLCEQGADKGARSNIGRTALHDAAERGHFPVMQYLCEQGADMEAEDIYGDKPLHLVSDQLSIFCLTSL